MRVWLLHIGEDLPCDPGGRRYRYSYLAEAIHRRGGETLRWAPTLRHTTKTHRAFRDRLVRVGPGYRVQLVHSPGYRAHVGPRRLHVYRVLARRFHELAPQFPAPDIIVAAIPSLEWADAAVRFGRARGVPVVVDIRDPWPDVFASLVPGPLRPVARLALLPYYRVLRRVCRDAEALTAVSPSYLAWAQQHADRPARGDDWVAPIGCEAHPETADATGRLRSELRVRGFDDTRPTCCYLGQLARSSDVGTALDALRVLARRGRNVQLLVCGDGSHRAALERRAEGLGGVYFLGLVDASTMAAVMRLSQIGLSAYAPHATQSLPNKPFEYLAGGVAVASSLAGDLASLLAEHHAGVTYPAGDAEALADSIADLLDDPQRLASIRENGQRLWRRQFQPAAVYDAFAERLDALRRNSASRAA